MSTVIESSLTLISSPRPLIRSLRALIKSSLGLRNPKMRPYRNAPAIDETSSATARLLPSGSASAS